MHKKIIRIVAIFLILEISRSVILCKIIPEQIHLSFGDSPQEIVVTWVTFSYTGTPFVSYGTLAEGLVLREEGYCTAFRDEGKKQTVRFVNRVVLRSLTPRTLYAYRCGSYYGLSKKHVFKVSPPGPDWSPRMIIYGDMGWKGAATLPFIAKDVSNSDIDAIVHVGDIAYNMDSQNGFIGDQFLKMIEPIASSVPYMTIPGNHEQAYNFSHYKRKFSMPGRSEGLFYSFNLGPAHFVALSSEVYYFTNYGLHPLINQYEWLQNDLREARSFKNKLVRPWIIVFTHRPLYCSSDDQEDCSLDSSILRCCLLNSYNYGLESLFHKYRVDVIYSGHMHYYERSFPLFDKQVYNGSFAEPYRNPRALVHIITGAAGMQSGPEKASYIRPDWFPFYSCEYSYTVLTVVNKTHIHSEQISASKGGKTIDRFWIIKDL